MEKPIALYAGSFDPVTNGHLHIIRRARKIFGSVAVVVMTNGSKKNLFSAQERVELLKKVTQDWAGVSVHSAAGLAVDFARQIGATVLVRGVRGAADCDAEMTQAYYNRLFGPELETVFLPTDETYQYISSSSVREVARCGGDLSTLVPEIVAQAIAQKLQAH